MPKSILSKKKPEKKLVVRIKKTGGRDRRGRVTVRHRGGGSRKLYRKVAFGQFALGQKGKVQAIEYDPNRNAFLMLVEFDDNEKAYLLAPTNIKVGDEVVCDEKTEVRPGNRMKLKNVPTGEQVYNVELVPGQGGVLVRSAGASARVDAHEGKYTQLMFPSTEVRKVLSESFASVGTVSNSEFKYTRVKNAGRMRLKGKRPHVKGTAMNPVDHPHGGGEGSTSVGMKFPKTPWGKPALGVKTRRTKKWTDKLIVSRRKKKRRKK